MIRQSIKGLIKKAILQAQEEKLLSDFILSEPEISVERAQDERFGDYSSNIALKIAKQAGKSSMELAEIIKKNQGSRIKNQGIFEKIEVVKPGFINFFVADEYLQGQVGEILERGENYGSLDIGENKKVQVEFISANPTGPLTLGNGRGGFMGDVLANVLKKTGFNVEREYYMNDTGHQVEVLGHSILGDEKAQYKGDYIRALQEELNDLSSKEALELGEVAAAHIMETMLKPVIEKRMEIKFNNFFSERQLKQNGANEEILALLKEKSLTYEKDGALWVRSGDFGDDKDRVLITSDKTDRGVEGTYFLSDIAYHYNKFIKRKFDKVIDIWGADHHGYMARLQAAGKALGAWDERKLEIIIIQLVRLFKDGQEVKMSKRAGTYITLDELLDEIPLDVARFFFLMYSSDTHLNFNMDLAKERSEKNPVYYVQYAYARIASILSKAREKFQVPGSKFQLLIHPAELALIKQLIRLPEIIEDTAADYQVQRLPQYALELVRTFHKFYEDCRVISDDENLTRARLALVEAARIILKNVLDLMGISAPEKM